MCQNIRCDIFFFTGLGLWGDSHTDTSISPEAWGSQLSCWTASGFPVYFYYFTTVVVSCRVVVNLDQVQVLFLLFFQVLTSRNLLNCNFIL